MNRNNPERLPCRMCDQPECDVASQAIGPQGNRRVICETCLMGILAALGIDIAECDHFHEGDEKEISAEVDSFFRQN